MILPFKSSPNKSIRIHYLVCSYLIFPSCEIILMSTIQDDSVKGSQHVISPEDLQFYVRVHTVGARRSFLYTVPTGPTSDIIIGSTNIQNTVITSKRSQHWLRSWAVGAEDLVEVYHFEFVDPTLFSTIFRQLNFSSLGHVLGSPQA
jgi:hypothetical protein